MKESKRRHAVAQHPSRNPKLPELHELMHHTELPATRVSRAIDPIVQRIGQWSSWLWVLLVGVITLNVILRYVFGQGLIQFEEIQWHIYAIGFLIGLSWCYQTDDHVRIDVVHEHLHFRTRCWIELIGISVALLPFLLFAAWYTLPFIAYSFSVSEISEAPGGLPFRWAIKSFLFIGLILLATAAFSRLSRVLAALFTHRKVAET